MENLDTLLKALGIETFHSWGQLDTRLLWGVTGSYLYSGKFPLAVRWSTGEARRAMVAKIILKKRWASGWSCEVEGWTSRWVHQ